MIKKDEELLFTKSASWRMFDEISVRYDLLNRILSLGLDIRWRRKLCGFIRAKPHQDLLDLATGTGDVLLALTGNPHIHRAIGIDMADRMLTIGKTKIRKRGLDPTLTLQHGDIHHLPFANESFDVATIAFGIRNVAEPQRVLAEMFRVLKPKGQALILEFSLPENPCLRAGHWVYLNAVVPLIGFSLSGHSSAYRYLARTIESFPYGDRFRKILKQMGFVNIQSKALMGGAATVYWADK